MLEHDDRVEVVGPSHSHSLAGARRGLAYGKRELQPEREPEPGIDQRRIRRGNVDTMAVALPGRRELSVEIAQQLGLRSRAAREAHERVVFGRLADQVRAQLAAA